MSPEIYYLTDSGSLPGLNFFDSFPVEPRADRQSQFVGLTEVQDIWKGIILLK